MGIFQDLCGAILTECATNFFTSRSDNGTLTGFTHTSNSGWTNYDRSGTSTSYTIKDCHGGWTNYDRYGASTGFARKDHDGWTFYDRYGASTGYAKKDHSGYTIYSRDGATTGYLRKDTSGKLVEYDSYGRRIGFVED